MSRALSPRQVWGMPVALGVLSLVGLVAALVSDGAGDALSWLALAVPAVACAWGAWRPRRASRDATPQKMASRPAAVRRPAGL